MTKEQALEKIKELENYIKKLDSKPKRFKAYCDYYYYSYDGRGDLYEDCCAGNYYDKENYILGNMFETEEQAEANKNKYLRKLEILEWMEDNRKEFELEGENNVIQSWGKDSYPCFYDFTCQVSKYVFTKEKAQQCIDKFGQDLKLIFE